MGVEMPPQAFTVVFANGVVTDESLDGFSTNAEI
jgi:hypothetical protein